MSDGSVWQTVRAVRFEDWRRSARSLLVDRTPPERLHWVDGRSVDAGDQPLLFDQPEGSTPARSPSPKFPSPPSFTVPPKFLKLAQAVACHRSPGRWELLYRLLWRLTDTHGSVASPTLLGNLADEDVRAAEAMAKSVRRDAHKMKAFVRFRRLTDDRGERYVAWHRPEHYTLPRVVDFFARRYDVMRWSILTPDESAHWDGEDLQFGPAMPRSAAPQTDDLETLWKTYYAHIFNPARIKLQAMRAEMPRRHWPTMPETEVIQELLRRAPQRVETMIRHQEGSVTAKSYLPDAAEPALQQLSDAADRCRGCDLHQSATQTVFGHGPPDARLVLIGEQPGDQEDRQGVPFVGPAGQLLRDAMKEADLPVESVYLTNAVKHLKFRQTSGKRRLHVKPSSREVAACRPWLEAEIGTIRPDMIVCLGATAAGTLFGPSFRVTKQRGVVQRTDFAPWAIATYHPSALLRAPAGETREIMRAAFLDDLRKAASHYHSFDRKKAR